jgi:hypothetical protein
MHTASLCEKDAHTSHPGALTVGLDQRAERIEEPAVTVELLLVLLLETEYDL